MQTKSAFIAIVGLPNVGKSSLLNRILGEKVAIVSVKPQTTRTRITGILTEEDTQLVFIDTPGMHRPKSKLSQYMVRQVEESVADVDAAILVVEPSETIRSGEKELCERFSQLNIPAVLAVNKIDSVDDKSSLLPVISRYSSLFGFDSIIPISAKTGDGVPDLIKQMKSYALPGPHFFDDDSYTDQPEKVIAAEIIREKLLRTLRDEIPHGIAIDIENMTQRGENGIIDINATIYCEKESHKGIIIGKNGQTLKHAASLARHDIEAFLDCSVNLKCWVKTREGWRNNEAEMRRLGFN